MCRPEAVLGARRTAPGVTGVITIQRHGRPHTHRDGRLPQCRYTADGRRRRLGTRRRPTHRRRNHRSSRRGGDLQAPLNPTAEYPKAMGNVMADTVRVIAIFNDDTQQVIAEREFD